MPEKKAETAAKSSPKKANLLDHHSIKHLLDESVSEIVTGKGFVEDVRLSNMKLLIGSVIILIIYTKEKNAILFTHPPAESFSSTGLVVSSKLPRFSDMYTLTIASADPQSISSKPPIEFTRSVTQWFTKEGILVEGLFWKHVEGLIHDYTKESNKSK
ncbi:hypothetical protein ACH5RR_016778 [Cinchona calisaya]|uniref:Signal peptidase complex subunit 2 n=1 Tax=Cinchona calisaya TaxID=153742 RepID=A0ABD2ZX00_9GENT